MREFVKGLLSDNGSPSSSRVYMLGMGGFMAVLLAVVFRHVSKLSDPALVSAWMSNLPMTLGGMAALVSAPYGINQGSNAFSDLMDKLKGKKDA